MRKNTKRKERKVGHVNKWYCKTRALPWILKGKENWGARQIDVLSLYNIHIKTCMPLKDTFTAFTCIETQGGTPDSN